MKHVGLLAGRFLFIIGYPLIALYLSKDERARIIIRKGDRVLVVKSWLGTGAWDIPGGGLHTDEDPTVGVIRELYEETGITVLPSEVRKLDTITVQSGLIKHPAHILTAQMPKDAVIRLQALEIAEARWVDDAELAALSLNSDYKRFARMVLRS